MRLYFVAVMTALLLLPRAASGSGLRINEVHYRGLPSEDFVELYAEEPVSAEGMSLSTQDNDNYFLPPLQLKKGDIVLYYPARTAEDDLDLEDGLAVLHGGRKNSILAEAGDEIYLLRGEDLVDFMRYKGGNGDGVPEDWEDNPGHSALPEQSLQFVDEEWKSASPTPGETNDQTTSHISQYELYR